MRTIKQLKKFALMVGLVVFTASVFGQALLVEDFDYPVGSTLTANGWTAHSAAGTNAITVTTPTITYPGYLSSGIGNQVFLGASGEDVHRTFEQQTAGVLYTSFLVNVSSTSTTGDYFLHLAPGTIGTTFRGRVFVKKDANDNIAFGITHTTSTPNYTPFIFSLNTTYLVVLKYSFISGAGNDVAEIIINPVLNEPEPQNGWLANTDASNDPANLGSIALRQGTTGNLVNVIVDGIRISTNWEDIAGPITGNLPPSISNIVQTPDSDITSETTVSVSAEITPGDAPISVVTLKWGTESGVHPNEINMTLPAKEEIYYTENDIPKQNDGTTVYYVIYAVDDNEESATSAQRSYTVRDPRFTTLPYEESFDANLGDCYVYTVAGIKPWSHVAGTAEANGYLGQAIEEHWLVLPGINFGDYSDEIMTFTTYAQWGTIDENNYLKLFYSTDYTGIGNPGLYTWNILSFEQPGPGVVGSTEIVTFSGNIDLSEISGTSVFLAFKYYSTNSPTQWRVDDINIFEASSPDLFVNPQSLSDLNYIEGSGPSGSQNFSLNGINLQPEVDYITVTGSENFEVSTDDNVFLASVQIPYTAGVLTDTYVYVRLKAGLDIGDYADETITVAGGGAATETVTVSGAVITPPPGLPYSENFSGFISTATLPEAWHVSNTTYGGDWGTGTSGGLRGNASVLGFQHTSSTGIFTASITLMNNTGTIIEELYIAYLGMVERVAEGRSPEWTVKLNGEDIPELFYSTSGGVDESKSVLITDLSIAENEVFTISWSSERGSGSGSSKQIGISDVYVNTTEPEPVPDNPVFSLAPGTYFENQTVFVANYLDYPESVEIYYTLDGEDPDVNSNLYDDESGIFLEDGNGPITLKAIAVVDESRSQSGITSALYTFPFNVDDIAAFRAGDAGALYRITGEVVVLHRESYRNRHFVRDASGSLTIWDDNDPNLITSDYNPGDAVTGFAGTKSLKNSNALIVLEAATDPGEVASSGNAIDPLPLTINDLTLDHTGNLVIIEDVTFQVTGTFTTGQNYPVSDPSTVESINFRTDFFFADYIGSALPEGTGILTGIIGGFGTAPQITARDLADLDFEEVIIEEPSNHVTNFSATANSFNSITVSWTDSDAEAYLVKGSTVSPTAIIYPVDGMPENDGYLVKNVMAGIESHEFTGLDPETEYFFKIFPYNGLGVTINYKTNEEVPLTNATTLEPPPPPFANVLLRPQQIDISESVSQSAVLMEIGNYPVDDARYRLYSGGTQYNCWNGAEYVSLTSYANGPQVPGTPTSSSKFWILFERGSNNSTAANYRDRLGPAYSSNFQTTPLPETTAMTEPFDITLSIPFTGKYNLDVKYVILGFDAEADGNLISATSSDLNTGDFVLKAEQGTTIKRIEVRTVLDELVDELLGTWSSGVPLNRFVTGVNLGEDDIECYDAENNITVVNTTIGNGASAEFRAGVSINFGEGFVAEAGSHVIAKITEVFCVLPEAILSSNEVEIRENEHVVPKTTSFFKVYPNPTAGSFTLELADLDVSSVIVAEIYGMMGEHLLSRELHSASLFNIDMSALPRGMYILRVLMGNQIEVQRIVKQ